MGVQDGHMKTIQGHMYPHPCLIGLIWQLYVVIDGALILPWKFQRLLTTIGSTQMGKRMIEYSHSSIKRFSLELGGDAPVLIFADTKDIKSAIADVVGLKFANGGQICVR